MLKIGTLELTTSRPDDLDARLVKATGCSSAELETLLGAGPDLIARAARPFLAADAPDHSEVARAVAKNMDAARDAVRTMYARSADPVVAADVTPADVAAPDADQNAATVTVDLSADAPDLDPDLHA